MAVQAAPLIDWGGPPPQSIAVEVPELGTPIIIPSEYTVIAAPAIFQLGLLSNGHAL
jgi:hypothetical protein